MRRRGEDTRTGGEKTPPYFFASSSLFLVWLLTLPAISPLFQPTLTRSADGLLHLYRLVALDQLIRQGVFFARWLPDLAYGYGLPLFVFYAPLSYYLTEIIHLSGLDAVAAFNVSTALALLLAATGVYLFVKDLMGTRAGLLAAIAYVYAPYQLFNAFSRGSLPVIWAGAVFPLAFWAFGRLIRDNHPIYLPLSALTLGAALLMHNISSMLFLPLLLFYLAIELLFLRFMPPIDSPSTPTFGRYVLLRISLALVLGVGLAAFFLLPATFEKEFVQVQRVITPPDFDYRSNFVNLAQLFSLPQPANTGLLNPGDPLTLGLIQIVLSVVGMGGVTIAVSRLMVYGLRLILPVILFAIISLSGIIFMMLPVSVWVWDALPLLAFVQQPHRLLGLTAFLLAILAGTAVTVLPERLSWGITLTGMVAIFITTVPLLYPRYYNPLPAAPSLTGMMAYEQATGAIGTTSFGEYLPIWVRQIPYESPLLPLYQTGAPPERLDRAYLPANAKIEAAAYGVNRANLLIESPEPYQAVFHTFYFPGWQANVDGQPVSLTPVTERGLVGVTMPTGRHQLELYFGETPLRLVTNLVSILALITLITLTVFTFKVQFSGFNFQASTSTNFTPIQFVTLILLGVALILTKTFYLDRTDNPLKRVFTGKSVAGIGVSRQVNFGDQINLLGYDLPRSTVISGQNFDLTLYWQARQLLNTDYSALVQLVDGQQHLYAGQDNLHPGNLPSRRWEPWGFVQDGHTVTVPPGTPPGDYFLVTGLYHPTTWARLPVLDGRDTGWPDVIAIPVRVTLPAYQPPTIEELGVIWPIKKETFEVSVKDTSKGAIIHLLGATPERETIRRNDFLRLALFWEAETPPERNYQVSLRLLAADDATVLAETIQPSFGRYPTSRWRAGERVRDNHALWIPPDFPAGTYRIQSQLLDEAGQPITTWLELGQLNTD